MQDSVRFELWKVCRVLILHCMSLNIHTSIDELPTGLSIAYFQKGYFQSQSYSTFIGYSNEDFFIPFDLTSENAISIPRSPFGSFICRKAGSDGLINFAEAILADLKERNVQNIEVHHPSSIYSTFVAQQNLTDLGFQIAFNDVNQHIELSAEWEESIHTMQKRKLESLKADGFTFRKMEKDEFEIAHKFLSVCRQSQGLKINIGWEQLKSLVDLLPDAYECFGVFRGEKISALCITVNVSPEIAYYYLPATSPMFRDKSPMVLLMAGMVDYYRANGFKYIDLGVSSFQGKPQETLRIFKERMGAKETQRPTFIRSL